MSHEMHLFNYLLTHIVFVNVLCSKVDEFAFIDSLKN